MGQKIQKPLYPDNEKRKLAGLRYDDLTYDLNHKLYRNEDLGWPYFPIKDLDQLKHSTFKSILYGRGNQMYGRNIEQLDSVPVSNTLIIDRDTINKYQRVIDKNVKLSEVVGFEITDGYFHSYLTNTTDVTGYDYVMIVIADPKRFELVKRLISDKPEEKIDDYNIMIPFINLDSLKKSYERYQWKPEWVPVELVSLRPLLKQAIYDYKMFTVAKYGSMKIIIEINGYLYSKKDLVFDPSAKEILVINFHTNEQYMKYITDFRNSEIDIDSQLFKSTKTESEPQPSAPTLSELEGH